MPFDIRNGLAKPFQCMTLFDSFCVLREWCFLDCYISPILEFLLPQRFQTRIASHKIWNTATTWVCALGSLWPCRVLVHSCVVRLWFWLMCSLFAQGPYVLQLMNLLVCIDPALEKNEKENTAKKALQKGSGKDSKHAQEWRWLRFDHHPTVPTSNLPFYETGEVKFL